MPRVAPEAHVSGSSKAFVRLEFSNGSGNSGRSLVGERRTTSVALNLVSSSPAGNRPAGAPAAVPTYLSWVGGAEVDSGRYLYTVTTRSLLDDVFASLTLKRDLEAGRPAHAGDTVVGRCAVAGPETVDAALSAAAQAA